ncbi:aldose epimerase [Granulicella sibirica]|uniref:DUF4432 domain-containing protein n=1 Tax=Granulicella sibirica TaxID=2479048 RepID=A0A4Q0SYL1_9BACT|nr:aldose epimerase [Granulicella sibirica]RXH54609.1 hypothetical protein GRAN_3713 [Granulicella sibirica]
MRAVVLADEGGRVQSLLDVDTGVEFLLQAEGTWREQEASLNARFEDGWCAGIEECLPSVGKCGPETDGGAVPDHGDFWQTPWVVEDGQGGVRLTALGFSRPLRFTKTMALRGRAFLVDYVVENVGSETTSFLYACHPLLAVEEGDVVVMPAEVTRLAVHSSLGARLGGEVSWPEHEGMDLGLVLGRDAGVAEMLYTPRLTAGWCGVYRAKAGQGIVLRFDPEMLPYVGMWLCYGGWPVPGAEPVQYAVALEPTVAACGTLAEAERLGVARVLAAGGTGGWWIEFEVSQAGMGLEEFRGFCDGTRS